MAEDEVPPVEEGTDDLLGKVEDLDDYDTLTGRMRRENEILGTAVDYISGWSEDGEISNANANALADALSDSMAHYTKTDIKEEFTQVFVDDGSGADGIPFDQLIEERLQEVKVVSTTDAKQGLIWRWHFSDGVQLETEKSKDDGRKHYDWSAWKEDYFEALITMGEGEQIAPPTRDRRDSNDWKAWITELLLEKAETVEHVGPRTEAVEWLKDYVNRQTAYADIKDMRDRSGIWMDAPPADGEGEAATDGGGPTEIRVPTQQIKRICDQAGIETRAFQIELDARGVTLTSTSGVSGHEYVDGQRVSFWQLRGDFSEPAEFVEEAESPSDQVEQEKEEAAEETRTEVGAIDGDGDETDEEQDGDDEGENATEEADSDEESDTDATDAADGGDETSETSDGFGPGITGGFGVDPDQDSDGGGE